MMVSLNMSLLNYLLFPRIYRCWLNSWSSGHLNLLWQKEMWWLTFLWLQRECHLLFPKVHNNKRYPIQELSIGLTPAFSMGRVLNLTLIRQRIISGGESALCTNEVTINCWWMHNSDETTFFKSYLPQEMVMDNFKLPWYNHERNTGQSFWSKFCWQTQCISSKYNTQ